MIRSAGTLAAVLGVTLGLTACGAIQPKGSYPDDDPRSAVHQFLRATVGQANGQRACALLTVEARERMARSAGTCRAAMDKAIVALPGSPSTGEGTGRAAEDVELEARVDGDRATIEVFRGRGPRMSFEVVRLSADELEQDTKDGDMAVGTAPESDWRVDRGAEQLVTETNRPAIPSPEPDPRG
ncbi:MAG: hypothetical protein ITG02_15745 [Patulibacter sp.]|nr:hypothetical protein [Patulibacter sp.]